MGTRTAPAATEKPDPEGRVAELLPAAVAYLNREGLENFSLASLATALGTSSRMLIYHFGSRDELLARVQAEMRRNVTAELRSRQFDKLSDAVHATWNYYVAQLSHMELFFHLVSRSFEEPAAFTAFSSTSVSDWEEFFASVAEREGHEEPEARTLARLALAGFRGLILDLAITGDLRRLARSEKAFGEMLDAYALTASTRG